MRNMGESGIEQRWTRYGQKVVTTPKTPKMTAKRPEPVLLPTFSLFRQKRLRNLLLNK
jgi:hypothetical protein